MKYGIGLVLIGVGAILAFAVTTNTSVLNIHTAGYIVMLIGILNIALPSRASGWMGRRLFVRRYERTHGDDVKDVTYPAYITRNPANTRVRAGLPSGTNDPTPEGTPGETRVIEDIYEE